MADSLEGRTLHHFRLLSKLGEGGMGVVYRAQDERLGRPVAIKVLPSSLATDTGRRERFLREARAAATVEHSAIATVYDIGEAEGVPFIAMELVDGETLRARLAHAPLPLDEVLRIGQQIAAALDRAHSAGVVHRDLKPDNVMVKASGEVKLLDFGLAKLREGLSASAAEIDRSEATGAPDLTREGIVLGTLAYMSPEQARGLPVDGRTDLFALGVLLYECLTGRHPFRGPSAADTVAAILGATPPSVSSVNPAVPAELSDVLGRLLAKSAVDRPPTARAVGEELTKCSEPRPVPPELRSSWGMEVPPPRWPLVARQAEILQLRQKLDQAVAGRGSLVLIGGEPGIGKTTLTEELLREARARNVLCLRGHCYDAEGAPPYSPFVEVLEHATRSVPPPALRAALGDAAPEIAKLAPELRQLFPDIPPPVLLPAEQQRRFLFNAYRDFTVRSCRRGPLLIVYEDLHWADEPTLQLLEHLTHAYSSLPILVAGTYRDVELDVGRPFARTLDSLVGRQLAARVMLRRLPEDGVAQLLAAISGKAPPEALVRAVHAETEGNPFFVAEVYQHLVEEGRLFRPDGTFLAELTVGKIEVPEGVRLVVGRRLGRLSEAARQILTLGALVGRTFSLRLLESLSDAGADTVLDAVEAAERARLLNVIADRREPRYTFTHELIRQTMVQSLSLPRRQRMHARIAGAIESTYAAALDKHAPALAHHLYQAGSLVDPDKATRWLVAAAEQAAGTAGLEEALSRLDEALSVHEGERNAVVADLQYRRGIALRGLLRPAEALEALRTACRQFDEADDMESVALVATDIADVVVWHTRDWAAVAAEQRDILRRVGVDDSRSRRRLLLNVAVLASASGDAAGGLEALAQANQCALPSDGRQLTAIASYTAFNVYVQCMKVREAIREGRIARELSQASGDRWRQSNVESLLVVTLQQGGDLGEVDALLREGQPRAERIGAAGALWAFGVAATFAAARAGDLALAEAHASDTLEKSGDRLPWVGASHAQRATIIFVRGRAREAMAELERGIATDRPARIYRGRGEALRFWMLASEGDAEAALRSRADDPFPLPDPSRPNPAGPWQILPYVIEALAWLGRRGEAGELRPQAEAAVRDGLVATGAQLYRVAAAIAASGQKDWAGAQEHLDEALLQVRNGYSVHEPNVNYWRADMLLSRGEPGDRAKARERLAAAAEGYARFGMPGFERRAHQRLAEIGG